MQLPHPIEPTGIISVSDGKIKLAYYDSGVPPQFSYITFFAIHGLGFSAGKWWSHLDCSRCNFFSHQMSKAVFSRVIASAPRAGVRFVSIVRRGYRGSTDFTEEELCILSKGSEEQRTEFLKDRGFEILQFIDAFIQRERLPIISDDEQKGGFCILGWSFGNAMAIAAVSHSNLLPEPSRMRVNSRLRTLILHGE
jgi:hypothetical protein